MRYLKARITSNLIYVAVSAFQLASCSNSNNKPSIEALPQSISKSSSQIEAEPPNIPVKQGATADSQANSASSSSTATKAPSTPGADPASPPNSTEPVSTTTSQPIASEPAIPSPAQLTCTLTPSQTLYSPIINYSQIPDYLSETGIDKEISIKIDSNFAITNVTIDGAQKPVTNNTVKLPTTAIAVNGGKDTSTKTITFNVYDSNNKFATCSAAINFVPILFEMKNFMVDSKGEDEFNWLGIDILVSNLSAASSVASVNMNQLSVDYKLADCKKLIRKEISGVNGIKLYQDAFRCALAGKHSPVKALHHTKMTGTFSVTGASGETSQVALLKLDNCSYNANDYQVDDIKYICSAANPKFIDNIIPTDSAQKHGVTVYPVAWPTDAILKSQADQLIFSKP